MLREMKIVDYIKDTASNSPVPGGGSVCSLVGSLAAALSSMVGEITIPKETDQSKKELVIDLINRCNINIKKLNEGIDEDAAVFSKVMQALKMPKNTEDEKNIRAKELKNSLKEAAEQPLIVAKICLDVMHIAIDMLNYGNKNVASDASVSGFLAYSALNGSLFNVVININSIKDEEYVNSMRNTINELRKESEENLSKIKEMSFKAIG